MFEFDFSYDRFKTSLPTRILHVFLGVHISVMFLSQCKLLYLFCLNIQHNQHELRSSFYCYLLIGQFTVAALLHSRRRNVTVNGVSYIDLCFKTCDI